MSKQTIELDVRIEREISYKEDSNWALYGCVPANFDDYSRSDVHFNKYGNMSVNGIVHRLNVGQVYTMTAQIVNDDKFGTQYKIISMKQDLPSTPEEQKRYIKMLVTDLQFKSIYEKYDGQDVVQMFKDNTFDYNNVYGFGEFTYKLVRDKVLNNIELQEIVNEFPALSDFRIINRLKLVYPTTELLIENLRNNPYILTDHGGIGFKTADGIALNMGIEPESPFRIQSCIRHVAKENEITGNTYIKENKLVSEAYDLLNVKRSLIKAEIPNTENIVVVEDKIATERTFKAEYELAKLLKIANENCEPLIFDVEKFIEKMENKYNIKLTHQQRQLFFNIKEKGVNFLLGYAGCGKSMLQKLVIELAKMLGLSFRLMAPTGKASKVLSEYTQQQASTIHRAVGIGVDNNDEGYFIYEDFIIIDESSMAGVFLMHKLMKSIANPNARILFVGDDFQLPSVECGSFLYDCKTSGVFPVTLLDMVFRQKDGGILDVVTMVRQGEKFIDDDFEGIMTFGNNCVFISCPQEESETRYLQSYTKLINKYGVDEVMVLSPTKKGTLGTFKINNNLQSIVNPKMDEDQIEVVTMKDKNEVKFRVSDRVLNITNSYNVPVYGEEESKVTVFNGDTGVIEAIYQEGEDLVSYIRFDDNLLKYPKASLDKILHSLCLTMHKSQGSAADAVISVTDKAHTYQLNANLLYTGWTRPRHFLVVIGQAKTINAAIKRVESVSRSTFLSKLLLNEVDVPDDIVTKCEYALRFAPLFKHSEQKQREKPVDK